MATDDIETSRYSAPGNGSWQPPITLAAQLAPRLPSQGNQTHSLSKETFSLLRQELTGGTHSQLHFDDKVTDISKLICIVLKAGLEPCTKDPKPDSQGQVLDCLDIVLVSIEKAPQTLTEYPDPLVLGESFGPLVIPLLDFYKRVQRFVICIRSCCNQGVSSPSEVELMYGLLRILEDIFAMDTLCQFSTLQTLSGLTKMSCRFQTLETHLQIAIRGFLNIISRISLECGGPKTVSLEPSEVFVSKSDTRFQQHELSSSAVQDEILQASKRRCMPRASPHSESGDTVQQLIAVSLALIGFTSPGGLGDLYPAVVTLGNIPCAMARELEQLSGMASNGTLLCHTPTYHKPQNRRNGHAKTNTAAYVGFDLFAASLFCVRRVLLPFPSKLHQRAADCHWVRFVAWTNIHVLLRLSNDEELNIILLRLVEYLGHPNPFVCAVAYTEISKLAQRLSVTAAGLFRPFWRTLSVTIMKNFQSRPYMAEHLCDLLGMKVDDFLRLTELYVLPHLVLTRKRDIIARIGATYKDAKTPFDICSEKNNLAAILAFLLSQASPNPQDMAMSALSEIDTAFEGRTLAELVRIEPILIACHLFKGLGDSGDEKRARFYRALQLLAALVPRKSGHASRRTNLVGYFIEEHILGIITEFAHAINDFQIRQPLVEKRRNIIAIGEMVKVAKGHICACLRSALEIEELCNDAFTVWAVLVNSLHDEDIEPLLDQTLSIVIRYWDMFTEDTRKCAYELVENILRNHSKLVHDVYNTMPSLASIPEMSKFESELMDLKGRMDVRSQFLAFVRRCQSENATVVEQALTELVPYLLEHDEFCGLDSAVTQRSRDVQADKKYERWSELPETVRNTLTPFLTSKYTVTVGAVNSSCTYPLFSVTLTHVGGTQKEKEDLLYELTSVLSHPLPDSTNHIYEAILLCSQSIFEILDYLSRWLQGKKKQLNSLTSHNYHSSRSHREACPDSRLDADASQVKAVEALLASIPPEVISKRAVECRSFSRALFHWEQYIRQSRNKQTDSKDIEPLFQRLQDIYSQIDEPDGIEGISNYLHALNIDQQVLEHRKAGRWATAQSWYELQLEKEPNNVDAQWNLLTCLKESGQQDAILTRFEILRTTDPGSRFVPFAIEASWITGKWEKLRSYLQLCSQQGTGDFNIGVGLALDAIRQGSNDRFGDIICGLRLSVAKSLNANSVASLQSCHDSILRLHALAEIESIAGLDLRSEKDTLPKIRASLSRRLDILGGHISDKQYLLGLRRAIMELTLLWKDGHHRKAIQTLECAIAANEFAPENTSDGSDSVYLTSNREKHQNLLAARVISQSLLHCSSFVSEMDRQSRADTVGCHSTETIFPKAAPVLTTIRWEKAHYYLGKHYNKILDSEKTKPLGKEAQIYLSGEASKLVIDNYLRSLAHGNKYVFQSLPKVLTLWLEHASTVDQPFDPKRGNNEDFQTHTLKQRRKSLDDMHSQLKKYVNRMPAALALTRYKEVNKKLKTETPSDMRAMINQGQRFSEEMLKLCVARVEKASRINLARALGFNHKVAPCRLVVPFQAMLTPTLPTSHDAEYLKGFRAFPRDPTTIEAVLDDAQVLNSLQKPRKISVRGSDGRIYNILCKPKDDLRKDQRLMEFNNMINRFLKRDVESSKRRMYIQTYAVTPLNEECGLIEWVDNLRTLRDIVIKLLRERGIAPNYSEIGQYLDEACSEVSKLPLFTTKILPKFPPVLHEWFVEMFPESGTWLAARLRYTRSCAVMSMVGYVLGLGDRHGENILFEEGTGGILHVDFNCLFDKGLTFDKPELVPFRLTQNMVDAFGAYGYDGPFRKTCEITLGLLRQNEDALMTVLETFLHDPTTDFIGKKRRTHVSVPETPAGVLENVRNKLRGLLPGESVPLSVDGHVDELIVQATDKKNLAAMYIGWCAFF
ncbi:hypothetical protein BDV38DRAFT_274097 [Aspergillus pseudotamarii]|uniref:non-specific serine/threonine protein kinase n=1 Tax=Aspergillus pseudotamarii TaxID=132259 RepID=A0A5N6SIQ4_ASPPS|nr:uncharacterized protein BDV38DRAFT_274097 [Aspergillus pseudotamarii]KAE8133779.1 hypothetical protein BDV38DRAFT_274097 [Aspergillus pseudotamarii]